MIRPLVVIAALLAASSAQAGGGANAIGGTNSSAGAALVPTPTVGVTYPIFFPAQNVVTTASPVQNTARCTPFMWRWATHSGGASMQVSTLGTGPLNFAIYSDAVDAVTNRHQPQTLLTDPSLAFTVTAAASVSVTFNPPLALSAGLYWACINDGTAADAVRWTGLSNNSSYVTGLIGTASGTSQLSSQVTALNIAATAGTTTANWPSFAGQTFTESSALPPPPFFALSVPSIP